MIFRTRTSVDVMRELALMKQVLANEHGKDLPPGSIPQLLENRCRSLYAFIHDYLAEDTHYMHHRKVELLQKAASRLLHLAAVARIWHKTGQEMHVDASSILAQLKADFDAFSRTGSAYIFRHCTRTKRTKLLGGQTYDGISAADVEKEAKVIADRICDEVLLSPKPVRIVLRHSDAERTRTLLGIIMRRVLELNYMHETPKVHLDGPQEDTRLSMHIPLAWWENGGDNFWDTLPPAVFLRNWLGNTGGFENITPSVDARQRQADILSFSRYAAEETLRDENRYTIVIGVSHAPTVDLLIYNYIPQVYETTNAFIKEASFCKIEWGELCYLGHWRRL